MRLIGLGVILAVGLTLAPLAVEAQQAGKVYRIGYLSVSQVEFDKSWHFFLVARARPTRPTPESSTRIRGAPPAIIGPRPPRPPLLARLLVRHRSGCGRSENEALKLLWGDRPGAKP